MSRTDLLKGIDAEIADAEDYLAALRDARTRIARRSSEEAPQDRSVQGTRAKGNLELNGSASTQAPSTAPLMLSIIGESDREWTVSELAKEMQARGWGTAAKNPRNAAKATAARLVKEGQIRRARDGVFVRPDHLNSAPVPDSGGSSTAPA